MARAKKADGDSYISETPDKNGYYHAFVSMGIGDNGKNDRRHIMRKDRNAVAAKVKELERARDAGKVPKKGKRPTVREMIERHLDVTLPARNRAPKTIYSYRSTAANHIYPRWGHIRVDRLRDDQIEDGIAQMLAEGYEPAGARKVLAILSSAYELMVKRGDVARNPCITVDPPDLGPSKQRALTEAQARKVVKTALGRPNARRWEVGLSQGLRQGEALGLRWSYLDIDVPEGEVGEMRVWWQLQRLPWTHGCADVDRTVRAILDPQKRRDRAAEGHRHLLRAVAQAAMPEAVPEAAGIRPAACLHPPGRGRPVQAGLPQARCAVPASQGRRPGVPRDQGEGPQDDPDSARARRRLARAARCSVPGEAHSESRLGRSRSGVLPVERPAHRPAHGLAGVDRHPEDRGHPARRHSRRPARRRNARARVRDRPSGGSGDARPLRYPRDRGVLARLVDPVEGRREAYGAAPAGPRDGRSRWPLKAPVATAVATKDLDHGSCNLAFAQVRLGAAYRNRTDDLFITSVRDGFASILTCAQSRRIASSDPFEARFPRLSLTVPLTARTRRRDLAAVG
jgi:hypothetical protein